VENRKIQGKSVLFSEMTPDTAWEDDFNDWYDHEHIPLRMGVPGFCSAQRYLAPGTRHYVVVYEMESAAVLRTAAYQQIKNNPTDRTSRMLRGVTGFTRYICDQTGLHLGQGFVSSSALDALYLFAVFFSVPAYRQEDFDDWYDQDHIPTLLGCPDWLMVRRFRITDGEPEPWTHLALHYLADARALDSPERERARASSWRARLAREDWFLARYVLAGRRGARHHSVCD
jgi:hypothetical protein